HITGRSKQSLIHTWHEGWRHLHFLLLYDPNWLFWYPGITIACVGVILSVTLILGPVSLGEVVLGIHTLLYAMAMVLIGYQWASFYRFAQLANHRKGIRSSEEWDKPKQKLEKGLIAGCILMLISLACSLWAIGQWKETGFGDLHPVQFMRLV